MKLRWQVRRNVPGGCAGAAGMEHGSSDEAGRGGCAVPARHGRMPYSVKRRVESAQILTPSTVVSLPSSNVPWTV
jgi:hypothetical protein